MQKPEQQMADICHLFTELFSTQENLRGLRKGPTRDRFIREIEELSQTLDTKLQAAKFFRRNPYLYFKYISIQRIEVVERGFRVSFEVLNGPWMDLLMGATIIGRCEYMEQVESVLELDAVQA